MGAFCGHAKCLRPLYLVQIAAPSCGHVSASMVDEDAAHGIGRNANEVSFAMPVDRGFREAHICFVDQRCRLQSVVGPLAAHVGACQPM